MARLNIVEIFNAVFDRINNVLNIQLKGALPAGTNMIGQMQLSDSMTGKMTSDSVTRPNDATAYAALDVYGETPAVNLEFTNVLTNAGGAFAIPRASIRIDAGAIPAGMTSFRLHLYSAAPTLMADNDAFDLPVGDRAKYLGYITFSTVQDMGATLFAQEESLAFMSKLAEGSRTIYGVLQTMGAFTPTALCPVTITLIAVPV